MSSGGPRASELPLVGRDGVLAELYDAIDDAAGGTGGCVVVEGTAGIGKSRLLSVAATRAAGIGIHTAIGSATELDRTVPLSTLVGTLRAGAAAGPDVSGLSELGSNRLLLLDRLEERIEDFVRAKTLLIVIDNAQWADELTALTLRVLVPRLASSPVLWLLARNPSSVRGPAQEAVDALIRDMARRVTVGPLAEPDVAELCTDLLGAAAGRDVLALAARAEGNPFLLGELLTTLRDARRVEVVDGVATLTKTELPAGFLTAVDHRLGGLSAVARRLLNAGAVLGRPFTVHEAAALTGRAAPDLVFAADEAVAAGALVVAGDELTFRHDLIREAVYDQLAPPVRLALHREAVTVVRNEGRSVVECVEHLLRSGHKGDEKALVVLREAVDTVTPSSPATAADLILRMLELLDPADPACPALTAEAVRLLASAGRVREAQELGERALHAGLDGPAQTGLLLGLAEVFKHEGRNEAVVTYTRRALAQPDVADSARAELLAIQAHGLLYTPDVDAADTAGAEAVDVARRCGQDAALVFGSVARSLAARTRGDLDSSLRLAHEAVEIADRVGGEARHRHPRLWLAPALAALDRMAEADTVFEMGQREANQLGTAWSQPLWHYYRAEMRLTTGRLDDAAAEAEAGVRVAEQLSALALAVPLLALLGEVAVYQDDLAAARVHFDRAEQLIDGGITVGPEDLAWRIAVFQEATGHQRQAMKTAAEVYAHLPKRVSLLSQEPAVAARLVRLALRNEARAEAEAASSAIRDLAMRNPTVISLKGAAVHAEALLACDRAGLAEAVKIYRDSPRPLARALALEDTGLAEDRAGNRDRAVELLEEALEIWSACRALRGASRVRNALRRLGVRRRQQAESEDDDSGWSSLTGSELRVVRLVAEGLTNREVAARLFLSPHTVDSHLRHSFIKLAVTSRVELTRQVLTHDGGEDPEMT